MSQQRDVIEQKGPNQIVRIRSDSETNLDDLFKAVMHPKDSQVPHSVPMRMRNLPPSFFKQPERGSKSASHSRESSADATYQSPPPQTPQQQQQQQQRGLSINHPRAHSSPATLQQTYTSTRQTTSPPQHLRQQNYEISDDIPLPPGWEMAKTSTGKRYFLNHLTQTTTWEDPRKKLSSGNLHTPVSHTSAVSQSEPPIPSHSPTSTAPTLGLHGPLGPLPEGWDQAATSEGEIYFINHIERTTSWLDPRIPAHLQRPIVLGRGLPQMPSHSPTQTQTQVQSNSAPSIAAQFTAQNTVGGVGVSSAVTSTTGTSNNQTTLQLQQKMRLHKLQVERERLRLRQQEILRQNVPPGIPIINELMLRHSLGEDMIIPTSPPGPNTELPPNNNTTTTGIDPFLSGNDFHSRQESADSGLGLGPNYSLPHTPEDFLMEDNEDPPNDDTTQQNNDLGFDSLQSSNLDLGGENMDSDDLVPSLQEELNADILSDVEALLNSNKDSVLTWL